MRCITHILNLVVNDGLKEAKKSIKKVKEYVRYIRSSPACLRKFKELSDLVRIESKCSFPLDMPIRWNSTYIILKIACLFKRVVEKYEEYDTTFRINLGKDILDFLDWMCVQKLIDML